MTSNTPLHVHKVTITMQFLAVYLTVLQMLFPSIMHTLESTLHLVPTSLTSTVMGMSLDSLTVHTPTQPHVVHQMLLEFAAKEILLQVCSVHTLYVHYGMLMVSSYAGDQVCKCQHSTTIVV